jgi:hypothetical protein
VGFPFTSGGHVHGGVHAHDQVHGHDPGLQTPVVIANVIANVHVIPTVDVAAAREREPHRGRDRRRERLIVDVDVYVDVPYPNDSNPDRPPSSTARNRARYLR